MRYFIYGDKYFNNYIYLFLMKDFFQLAFPLAIFFLNETYVQSRYLYHLNEYFSYNRKSLDEDLLSKPLKIYKNKIVNSLLLRKCLGMQGSRVFKYPGMIHRFILTRTDGNY